MAGAIVGDVERGALRVVHVPEHDGVDIDRHGVARERLLGVEAGGLDALVNNGGDGVDDRDDHEQAGPFDAGQFAGAQDDETLPVVGHLEREGDEDGDEADDNAGHLQAADKEKAADGGEHNGDERGDGIHGKASLGQRGTVVLRLAGKLMRFWPCFPANAGSAQTATSRGNRSA